MMSKKSIEILDFFTVPKDLMVLAGSIRLAD